MNPEVREIWRKICAFEIDAAGATLPFSMKLAREQDWSAAHAARAIEEYRRFLLLGVAAGHPVSPSDAVDQVWHLHLTYTRSYWDGLCKGVLGQPFHHVPSEGRPGEGAKYADRYTRTLASYERLFGHAPPSDIWPRPVEGADAVGAKRTPRHRRVDAGRHWVIPRPRALIWWAGIVSATALLLFVGGCREEFIAGTVFDLRGPEFLKFYAVLAGFALMGSLAVRRRLRGPGGDGDGAMLDDPYAWAWLAGGLRRATLAGVAGLMSRQAVALSASGRLSSTNTLVADLHPFEQGLLTAVQNGKTELTDLLGTAQIIGAPIEAELQRDRLLMTDGQRSRVFWRSFLLAATPAVLGAVKIGVGLHRDKPVSFLVMMVVVSLVIAFAVHGRGSQRTRRGDRVLTRLKSQRRDLKSTASAADEAWAASSVALFGTSVLAGTMFSNLHESRKAVGGDGGTFSGGGCGSSCGGGDGGGGGGGGCGGCGGD